jgi:hypothetical protein
MAATPKLKILFLAANPLATTQLRLDQELRDIQGALRAAKHRDAFILHSVWATRIADMRQAMLDYEPHVVHFAGHGENGAIILEDSAGHPQPVGSEALGRFFTHFPTVQCAVLNACYSDELGAALTKTIPYVVGMQAEVEDDAAIIFAVTFYNVLGAGGDFARAFSLAANALELEGKFALAAPVLVQGPGHPPAAPLPNPSLPPGASPALHPGATSSAAPSATPSATPSAAVPSSSTPRAPITRLTGPQFKQLHAALLAAYTEESLAQMLKLELDVDLAHVAGGSNFSAVAFNLIDWAQRTGRLAALIAAAAAFTPASPDLQAFAASL